jgi:hypothetical protein
VLRGWAACSINSISLALGIGDLLSSSSFFFFFVRRAPIIPVGWEGKGDGTLCILCHSNIGRMEHEVGK